MPKETIMAVHNLVLADEHSPSAGSTASEVTPHSIGTSLLLHLLPGVAMLAFVALVAPLMRSRGLPPLFAGALAILFVLVPVELGYLLYLGWKRNGHLSLRGIVRYRDHIPRWQYFVFAQLMIIWFLAVMSWWRPVGAALAGLSWLPPWLLDPAPLDASGPYSPGVERTLFAVRLLLSGLVAPIVEELYFRGYLLPRIDHLGWRAPLLSAVLFALYHLWALPVAPGRALGFLPIVYFAWRRRNVSLAILVHCLLNLVAVIASSGG
jgi:membrane protease YdiL (CAAX protease family)